MWHKLRQSQVQIVNLRPSSVQQVDWRVRLKPGIRHRCAAALLPALSVTNLSSRIHDLRGIRDIHAHTTYAAYARHKYVGMYCHFGTHARLASHASRESVLYSWRRALGKIITVACMWFDNVCLLSVTFWLARIKYIPTRSLNSINGSNWSD